MCVCDVGTDPGAACSILIPGHKPGKIFTRIFCRRDLGFHRINC